MTKTIVITGDLLIQENLFVRKPSPILQEGAYSELDVQVEHNGAWRLADFAQLALGEPKGANFVISAPERTSLASHAVALWAPFALFRGKKANGKDRVWRLERHLGIKQLQQQRTVSYKTDLARCPDILVIEDLALGFRNTPENWPLALRENGKPGSIILATTEPLFEGKLWGALLREHRDRLTVIVPVQALRSSGAAIRGPLSWDSTIEETAAELMGERFANSLGLVRRVVVVYGTDGAASFTRLPVLGSPAAGLSERVEFETCLYDPTHLEGSWTSARPGLCLTDMGTIAAAMVRHELEPSAYPLYIALGRGLAAARELHANGAGPVGQGHPDLSTRNLGTVFHPRAGEPAATYFTAFPHRLLDDPKLGSRPATSSDLLEDFTGAGFDSVISTGIDVVLRGPDIALKPVPKANFGKYFTVDRGEIERINSIRNLIVTYLKNPSDDRPLCLAVFGPPGCGKSFAVRELMRDIAGDSAQGYSFNLSQMRDRSDLLGAFHRIRDASTRNQTPFVFWDEFDTSGLDWLKDFLSPMQDAEFHADGVKHPFGRAIFIFAGSTAVSRAEFDKGPGSRQFEAFKSKKGPDFISRLRGYIDVKGPNPAKDTSGHAHVIRRAIMLRLNLQKHAPHLVDPMTGHLAVDAAVVRAFLTATHYPHGARSMESIISMSSVAGRSCFGQAELPSADLLELHVTDDFETKLREPALGMEEIEALAIATHEAYRTKLEHGEEPDPNDVPFGSLPDDKKESNRSSARSTLVALAALGYGLVRAAPGTSSVSALPAEHHEPLKRLEHDRWLREVLQSGWAYGNPSNPALRLNKNILPFDRLDAKTQPLDFTAVRAILDILPDLGYAIIEMG